MGRKDCCKGSCGTTFEAKRWIAMDPGGMIGASMSVLLHGYAVVMITTHLLEESSLGKIIFICLYLPTVCMALISLYMAWSTDPGSVPLGARPLVKAQENIQAVNTSLDIALSSHINANLEAGLNLNIHQKSVRRCHKCEDNYKPPRAHHDSVTGRCIVKMDHFCPWIGNVVGILNHKFFILFILYTCLSAIVSSFLIINRVIACAKSVDDSLQDTDKSQSCQRLYTPFLFILAFETILFFLFTVVMLFEQMETIKSGTSKIARMKLRQGADVNEVNESPVIGEVNEIFGGSDPGLSWHWFIPIPVIFPPQYKDEIMGYEFHQSWHGEIYEEEIHEQEPESGNGTDGAIDLHNGNIKDITVKKRPSSRLEMEDELSLI